MHWKIQRTFLTRDIEEYFAFNEILIEDIRLLQESDVTQLELCTDCVVVIDSMVMARLLKNSMSSLIDFVSRGNRLWVWSDHDVLFFLDSLWTEMQLLDHNSFPGQVQIFNDAPPVDAHWFHLLRNIQIDTVPVPWCTVMLPIRNGIIDKVSASRDYMLTMVEKADRPHRAILWKEITTRPGLLEKGHAVYHTDVKHAHEQYQGQRSSNTQWGQFYHFAPSMDLYLDSWFEIVPETFCNHGHLLTEKTAKALSTKTPFLAVSTPGYLKYLHQLGFQTFGGLINENYDNIDNLNDRIASVVDSMQDIIKQGSESFYRACLPVLEHNHKHLAYLVGIKKYQLGLLLSQRVLQVKHT
jgi:hypothetical protein